MNPTLECALEILAVFTVSDIYGTSPRWHTLLTAAMAHLAIGMVLGLIRVSIWWPVAVFIAWCCKEVFGDIPNGQFALTVVFDSLVDVSTGLLGFLSAKHRLDAQRCSCRTSPIKPR